MAGLVNDYSQAIRARRASLFVGAGLSQPAGLPGWNELISEARERAGVPTEVEDSPLAAEYIADEIGDMALNSSMLKKLAGLTVPTDAHRLLAALPIFDYWTTNYDVLLERAIREGGENVARIVNDSDLLSRVQVGETKQLFKMHGSLNEAGETWESPPVLTRTHFETYEHDHPRFWAQLRAQFLTRSFLFLGLSFVDPNINVLLRLARSLDSTEGPSKHWAIMRREDDALKAKLQKLRVADLEKAGIQVHLIDDYAVQDEILADIETRTRNPNVFISGSRLDAQGASTVEQVATQLADDSRVALLTFGGEAAFAFCQAFKDALEPEEYRPERIRHYYRSGTEITLDARIGTAIFTDKDLAEMRTYVLPLARGMLVFGGGDRTMQEVELAREQNIAIVPVASTGGTAKALWDRYGDDPSQLNLPVTGGSRRWSRLNSSGIQSAQAALQILRASMFE